MSAPGFNIPQAGPPPPANPGYYYPPGQPQQPYPQPMANQPFPPPIQNQPYSMPPGALTNWATSMPFEQILSYADSLIVKQKVEILELVTSFETENKYTIKDQSGNKLFYAIEQSGCCNRNIFGRHRSFRLSIFDLRNIEFMHIEREVDCSCCCGLFCPDQVMVKLSGSNQVIGSVRENFSCYPSYSLNNAAGQSIFTLEGPLCATAVCLGQNVNFDINSNNGMRVGQISKTWGGIAREFFTDADTFKATFPKDLDLNMKMVCLGALFLIDFNYFERTGNQ